MSTLASILVFAQEAAHGAEHEETSKTPFYIAGIIAATYAVVLTFVGLRKHDFPSSQAAVRGICAVSLLIVVGTMASSVLTS